MSSVAQADDKKKGEGPTEDEEQALRAAVVDEGNRSSSRVPGSERLKWCVRPMRPEDIERCLEIWLQVELCEAHETVASTLRSDPGGFHVAELANTGKVIGMCAGTLACHDTAFMGFYAVEPRFQGLGVGRDLWTTTMKRLAEPVNIGLYGVPAMSAKYKRAGFKVEDRIRMLIFESKPGQVLRLNLLNDMGDLKLMRHARDDLELIQIDGDTDETIFSQLVKYDALVNKFSREQLLRNYLKPGAKRSSPLTLALIRFSPARSGCCGGGGGGGGGGSHSPMGTQAGAAAVVAQSARDACDEDDDCDCEHEEHDENPDEDEEARLSGRMDGCLTLSSNQTGERQKRRPQNRTQQLSQQEQEEQVEEEQMEEEEEQEQEQGGVRPPLQIMGYGCVRQDNTGGGMVGPIYAESSAICEVLLKNLLDRFELKPGGKFSAMSLTSNYHASDILEMIGLQEMDQCSRMFTKFVPRATSSKIYYVHSPNFTLF